MRKYLLLFVVCIAYFNYSFSQTAGTLNFTALIAAQSSSYGNKHFVAIWIENNAGTFIKTKNRLGSSGNSNNHLCQWKNKSASNVTDATTGATVNSYTSAVSMAQWNGTNVAGTLVADGTYKVWIETCWDDATGNCGTIGTDRQYTSLTFTKGPAAVHLTGQVSNIFTMTLDWVPAAAAPVANFTSNSTNICQNNSISFTDQSTNTPTSWSWNFGDGQTSTTQNPTHTYTTAGTYTVSLTATNSGGSNTATQTNYITVNPNVVPTISISGINNICTGDQANFTATQTNGGTPNYQWQVNGSNVGTNSSTYSSTGLNNAENVTCILTSNANCALPTNVTSNTVTMTVNPIVTPNVIINPSATIVCPGTSVVLTAIPTNGGNPVFSWAVDGNIVGTNSTYSAIFTNGQNVICTMTSDMQCANPTTVNSNTFVTSVYTVANVIVTETTGTLNSDATSGNQWYEQTSGIITGETSSSYTPTSNGNYYSIVTDANGCTSTSNTINFIFNNIENKLNESSIIILYPNPSNGILNIESNSKILQVEVTDFTGKNVLSEELINTRNKQIIDITSLSNGIYFLKINNNKYKVVLNK